MTLYFYTKIDLIEVRWSFKGTILPKNVLGFRENEIIKVFGLPDLIKTTKNQQGQLTSYLLYEKNYGTLGFKFDDWLCSTIFVSAKDIDEEFNKIGNQ